METPAIDPEVQKQDCRDRRVRLRACFKIGIGAACFGVILYLLFLIFDVHGYAPPNAGHFFLIPCIPFVYFCIGLIELISGRPFRQWETAWMNLRGWQRGIIGTIILLASLVLFILGIVVFIYLV